MRPSNGRRPRAIAPLVIPLCISISASCTTRVSPVLGVACSTVGAGLTGSDQAYPLAEQHLLASGKRDAANLLAELMFDWCVSAPHLPVTAGEEMGGMLKVVGTGRAKDPTIHHHTQQGVSFRESLPHSHPEQP